MHQLKSLSSWSLQHVSRSSNGQMMQLGTLPAGIDGHQAAVTKMPKYIPSENKWGIPSEI